MIRRSARPAAAFTVLANTVIRDGDLSFKARGLLVYLLSLPDNWRITAAYLVSQSPSDGMHAVLSGLKELERAGYLRRERERSRDGQLRTVTVVYDTPCGQPCAQPVDN